MLGFRDPYVIETGGGGRDWRIVLGSGIAGRGGALLVYASAELTSGDEPCDARNLMMTCYHWQLPTSPSTLHGATALCRRSLKTRCDSNMAAHRLEV